ncbi:MAG: hypothetical protein K1X89_11945 [Myxococcaceae bacterium]|nr:hypothetical protein [Myxococcaceae bacterium]
MWRISSALWLVASLGCRQGAAPVAAVPQVADAALAPSPPRWPVGLTEGLTSLVVARTRGDEPRRETRLSLEPDAGWRALSPHRGEADLDALKTLALTLKEPQVRSAGEPLPADAKEAFRLELGYADGGTTTLRTFQVALGAPVPVEVSQVGTFALDPAVFATGLPDPTDYLSTGLWVSAPKELTRLTVKGRRSYQLDFDGKAWRSSPKASPAIELEDVVGVFLGREATEHPSAPPSALGLDTPAAVATLCAGATCREFHFGTAKVDGVEGFYAGGPDADPIAIHPNDWALVVDGPFPRKR